MEFVNRSDVTKFVKECSKNVLHDVISEIISYPQLKENDVFESVSNTTLEYDGTNETFKNAISQLKAENKIIQSTEIEWIGLVLNHFCDRFQDYCVGTFQGILIVKNELPFLLIKNTKEKQEGQQNRYIRFSYDLLKNAIPRKQQQNYSSGKSFVAGFVIGSVVAAIVLLTLIPKKEGETN